MTFSFNRENSILNSHPDSFIYFFRASLMHYCFIYLKEVLTNDIEFTKEKIKHSNLTLNFEIVSLKRFEKKKRPHSNHKHVSKISEATKSIIHFKSKTIFTNQIFLIDLADSTLRRLTPYTQSAVVQMTSLVPKFWTIIWRMEHLMKFFLFTFKLNFIEPIIFPFYVPI